MSERRSVPEHWSTIAGRMRKLEEVRRRALEHGSRLLEPMLPRVCGATRDNDRFCNLVDGHPGPHVFTSILEDKK